ncbi:hypothetical protein AYJ66_17430 [Dietzia cinnamea]|nr:hypothetical protein AYJ66_17430 [Dietzia cinnamea]
MADTAKDHFLQAVQAAAADDDDIKLILVGIVNNGWSWFAKQFFEPEVQTLFFKHVCDRLEPNFSFLFDHSSVCIMKDIFLGSLPIDNINHCYFTITVKLRQFHRFFCRTH